MGKYILCIFFIAVFILIYAQIIQNETNESLFHLASQFFWLGP